MGRYYYGDISGKFWFACQSSYDASNYGVKHKDVINFHICHCTCEEMTDKIYCESCYDSYEQHIESIKEEEEEKIEIINTWYISETEISYEFSEEHIDQVNNKIKELEGKVGNYMKSFKIIDENEEITYHIDLDFDDKITENYTSENNSENSTICQDKKNIDELIARLCLGKLIHYSLIKKGCCIFFCEC
jgi:hypothetical protein